MGPAKKEAELNPHVRSTLAAAEDGTGRVLEFARDIFGGKRPAPRRAAPRPARDDASLFCAWHAVIPLRRGAALCAGRVLSGRRRRARQASRRLRRVA